jgi:hypothetical protein
MSYAIKTGDEWHEIVGPFTVGEGDDAIQYPANWIDAASPEELAAIGVHLITEPEAPSADVRTIGSTIEGDDVPQRVLIIDEPSLAALKAIYVTRAEGIRDERLNGGCETPSGRVDSDIESRLNISGSVQMAALLGAAFTARWRRADNSYITLDATAMSGIGLAAGQHVATCYSACFAIKDAIAAATTRDAVRAIDLTAGYPD